MGSGRLYQKHPRTMKVRRNLLCFILGQGCLTNFFGEQFISADGFLSLS